MGRNKVIPMVLALWLFALASVLAQGTGDAAIRAEILRRIQGSPNAGVSVNVSVQNGVATVEGTLNSFAQKIGVLNTVKRTIGARSVVDRLIVSPSMTRTDAQIEKSVRASLNGNLTKDELSAITIHSQDRTVTLSGTLASSYSKQIAGLLAAWAPGVTDVRNDIVVKPAKSMSDLEIQADVRSRLGKNPFVSSRRIDVTVRQGVVTLDGVVDSYVEADQAESVTRFAPGVVDVHNNIFVRNMGG